MHYKNNREAHEGDPAITVSYGTAIAGKLHSLMAGNTSCNAQIAYPTMGGIGNTCVTIGECYHAADAFAAIEATIAVPSAAATPPAETPVAPVEPPKAEPTAPTPPV